MTLFCLLAPSYAAPISSDPGGGGVGGNAASAPGPSFSYPWVGTVDDTNTGTGNKTTDIPTIRWIARGGLTVDLTLYHNSETNFRSPFGYKWLLIYQSQIGADSSGNVGVAWGDGRKYKFGNTSGVYSPPPGIHEKLIVNGSNPVASYDIIEKDQTKYHFANYGGVYVLNTITDENGNQITINNSSNGGLLSVTDPSNRTVTFGYNGPSAGFYNTMTDPLGHVVNLSYDANGNLSQVTYPTLNGSSYSTVLGYDPNHNVTSIKDMRGNTSTFSYNSADNSLAWEKDNLGNQTTFAYGSPYSYDTTITDPNGNKTIHAYTSGRLSQVTDALGYYEAYSYDGDNNVTQKQDRLGNYWASTYDGMGNVLTSTPPGDRASTMTYNGHNKLLTAQAPMGRSVAVTYDAYDNPTQVQQKDASGNVLATTKVTIGSYGLVSDKYDPNGHHTGYTYDGNGYLNSTTTQLGNKTQWTYDALGFQTSRIDAMSRTTSYTPDAWERLITTTYPDNTTNGYAYDPNGNLTAFTNYVAAWTRSYDADNRFLSEFIGPTRLVSHTYDAPGQKGLLSTTTDTNGRIISSAYTARNELATQSEAAGTTTYQYDPDGNQSAVSLPNGRTQTSSYNNDGTLNTNYSLVTSNNYMFEAHNFFYNADHQITQTNEGYSTNPAGNTTVNAYGYDGLGHLTSASRTGDSAYSRSYSCDGAGNRVSQGGDNLSGTSGYDADDEMVTFTNSGTSYAGASFGYDANGERTAESTYLSPSSAGYATQYGYDFDGNLTSITKSGNTTTFLYDALGRQVARTANGVGAGYYLDGDRLLSEQASSGATVAQYSWGNELICANGQYPLTDGHGSVRHMTDGVGTYQATVQADPFGVTVASSGTTTNPYLYNEGSGYRSNGDGPTGASPLMKVGARYYDPEFGCFMTRDTNLSQSPYVYCDGDPVNNSDPSGHAKKKKNPIQVAIATVGAALSILTGSGSGHAGEGGSGFESPPSMSQPSGKGSSGKGSSGAGGGGSQFSNVAKAGGLLLVGYGLYEGVKWGVGILGAPETGGASLALAALLP